VSVLRRARLMNLGLLGGALLSVGVVVWTERVPTHFEQEVRQRHLLAVFRREDVQRIELRRGDQRTVIVRRAKSALAESLELGEAGAQGADEGDLPESEWSLAEPFETDADPVPVDQLLGNLQYATWERQVDAAPAEAPSVAQPELSVTLDRVSYRMRLGGDAVSPPGARYVEVFSEASGARTFVVKKRLADGSECRKCQEATAYLQSRGLWSKIDDIVWAQENDATSPGMVLGVRLAVPNAPFFVVSDDKGEAVYVSVLQLVRDRFGTTVTAAERARTIDAEDIGGI